MRVAPPLTMNYRPVSNWTEKPPVKLDKPSPNIPHTHNAVQNSVGLESNQEKSTSLWLPVTVGLTVGLLCGGTALAAATTLWLTSSITTTTTTSPLVVITALWNFDNNTNDQYNNYNGIAINTPSYVTGYTNLSNSALYLMNGASQYVSIADPFLNLTSRSFTIEIWFYPTILSSGSYGLFGQCQTGSMDLCLALMIKNYYAYFGFYSDDLTGVTTLSINKWYHLAFVYDNSISSQSIYLNGVLESNRSSNSYKGMNGSILIGAIDNGTKYYFTGVIDQVSLITRAKTATEILNDATLVCYYSFDSNSLSDSGPLNLNGSGVNTTIASGNGRINGAISFASTSSYFVIGRLTKLGTPGQSYSIALWINPTSVNGGTIAHVSKCAYYCPPAWCLAFIGFTSTGAIAIQSWRAVANNTLVSLTGPNVSTNAWTHVAQTYSPNNGMSLYVNGLLSNQSSAFTYSAANAPDYIFLGSFPLPACVGFNTIAVGQYYGLLDEFRIFSREITSSEVYALAYP